MLQAESRKSYARRDFNQTLELVDELVREAPEDARYHEMRAAVRVDDKKFAPALEDYEKALSSTPGVMSCPKCSMHDCCVIVACWPHHLHPDSVASLRTNLQSCRVHKHAQHCQPVL
jgi:hypothetical protein